MSFLNTVMGQKLCSCSPVAESHVSVVIDMNEIIRRNKVIEEELEKEKFERKLLLNLLLLGGPESGKSTILKQMKILHLNGFTTMDLVNYKYIIHNNVVQSTDEVLQACKLLNIPMDFERLGDVKTFRDYLAHSEEQDYEITEELGKVMERIYASNAAQKCIKFRHQIDIMDSAVYFLGDIARICAHSYSPTVEDILKSRVPTKGIHEIEFKYRHHIMRMIDVGGQKSERKKWINCFDSVSGVLFIAAISDYCQQIKEEEDITENMTNRLKRSMLLFKEVVNNPVFGAGTAMILFLNKIDIFRERIKTIPLTLCFPKYRGPDNAPDDARLYVERRFQSLFDYHRQNRPNRVYSHFTNATDARNIDVVFSACADVIFKTRMERVGVT